MAQEICETDNIGIQSETLHTFRWNIENFADVMKNSEIGEKMISPTALFGACGRVPPSMWNIVVYRKEQEDPQGNEEQRLVILLKFSYINQDLGVTASKCELFFVDGQEREQYICSITAPLANTKLGCEENSFKFSVKPYSIFERKYFIDGILRVKIKLWVQNQEINAAPPLEPQKGQLHSALSHLLLSGKFSDVSIVVEGVTLKAHKNILACRSPVFAAMLQNDMEESVTNTIKIEEFSSKTVQAMLQFIYHENVECINEDYVELLKISEKYDLENLKTACINSAILKLSSENAVELLILGDMYNAPELKSSAMNFINSSKGDPIFSVENENSECLKLAERFPKLLLEMYANVRKNSLSVIYSSEELSEITEQMTMFTTSK